MKYLTLCKDEENFGRWFIQEVSFPPQIRSAVPSVGIRVTKPSGSSLLTRSRPQVHVGPIVSLYGRDFFF